MKDKKIESTEQLPTNELTSPKINMELHSKKSDITCVLASKIFNRTEESFISEYLQYDKIYKSAMYSELMSVATKNIISNGDICNFKKYLQFISCIHKCENVTNSKKFKENMYELIKFDNLLITASKYNRIDIIKYILNDKSHTYAFCIRPGDKDNENHNVFHYAIRSNNIELIKVLLDQWQEYVNSEELIRALAEGYEELKLKNFDLPTKLVMFIAERMIDYHLYSNDSEVEPTKISIEDIKERGQLLIEAIKLFIAEYSETDKFDNRSLLLTKFIISNIHILKQQMKATYATIFWEEMEFCLTIFVYSKLNRKRENLLIYKFMMTKSKLLNYLDLFANMLADELKNISDQSVDKLSAYPSVRRTKTLPKILKSNPKCKELYEDFQRLKDAYSLHVIIKSVEKSLSLKINPEYEEGQYSIKRTLQLLAEMMRNNWESPNMTRSLSLFLLSSMSLQTRQILVNFHNSSSLLTQTRKLDIELNNEYDEHLNIYDCIQKDFETILRITKGVLHVTVIHYLSIMLETISQIPSPDDLKSYLASIDMDFDYNWFEDYIVDHDIYLRDLINHLSSLIRGKSPEEESLCQSLTKTSETRGVSTKYRFVLVAELINFKNICSRINEEGLTSYEFHNIKNYANIALANKLSEETLNGIHTTVPRFIFDLVHSFSTRIVWRTYDEMMRIINQIHIHIGFGLQSSEWLDNLRTEVYTRKYVSGLNLDDNINFVQEKRDLSKTTYNECSSKLCSLKNLFGIHSIDEDYKRYKKTSIPAVAEIITLELLSTLNSSGYLVDNYILFDHPAPILVGKILCHHLAQSSLLAAIEQFDPMMVVLLNAQKLSTRGYTNHHKIGRPIQNNLKQLKSRYNQNLSIIMNQYQMYEATEEGNLKKLDDCLSQGADTAASDYRGWTTLHYAAKGGSYEIFEYICDNNIVSMEAKDANGRRPLHVAVKYRQLKIIKFLIDKKVSIFKSYDNHSENPLYAAVRFGYKEIVELFLSCSKESDIDSESHKILMQCAVVYGHKDIVEMLYERNNLNIESYRSIEDETLLHLAAKIGHEEVVRCLINLKCSVHSTCRNFLTPLHLAANYGNLNVAKILISKKADINACGSKGSTPLHKAIKSKHDELAKFLIENGAQVNVALAVSFYIPLHFAARNGSLDIVKLLIKHKAAVNFKNFKDRTPLHFAIFGGHFEVTEFLLQNKANIRVQDIEGNTPIHSAAVNGNVKILELLLKNGASFEKKNFNFQTPLHLAVNNGHLEIVKILVNRGANFLTFRDKYGFTALHMSVQGGYLEIVEFFISKKANLNVIADNYSTALTIAADGGFDKIVKALVKGGAKLTLKNEYGLTALHVAIKKNRIDVINYLLTTEVDVGDRSPSGKTSLHFAAENNQFHIVEKLIKRKHELIHVQDNARRTPLYLACLWNYAELVKLFIKNGAEIVYNGMHCMEAALSCGNKDVVDVLLNSGVNINDKLPGGIPFLHRAVQFEHSDLVKNLIAKKINVNAFSDAQETAIMIAAENGYTEIATILLKNKADPDLKNNRLQSALDFAVIENQLSTLIVLLEYSKEKLNKHETEGFTLLHMAALCNCGKVINFLIDHKFDVNIRDQQGKTPLHMAAAYSCREAVEVLMQKGAHYNAVDNYNFTPKDHAVNDSIKFLFEITKDLFNFVKENNYYGCLDCLRKHAAVNAVDTSTLSPLHYACWLGSVKIVRLLLSFGARASISSDYGNPLHFAVRFGYNQIVGILLAYGAIYNPKTIFNHSLIQMATNLDIIYILKLIEKVFTAIRSGDITIVDEFTKIKDYYILQSILNTCDQNEETFYVVAKKSNFPIAELAKIYGYEDYLFIKTFVLDIF